MSVKQKFNIFEKNVWYSCDFGRFFVEIFHDLGWFFATRIRFMAELKRIRNTEFNIHLSWFKAHRKRKFLKHKMPIF